METLLASLAVSALSEEADHGIALLNAHGETLRFPNPPEPMSNGGTGAMWIRDIR